MKNFTAISDRPVRKDAPLPVILIMRDAEQPLAVFPFMGDVLVYDFDCLDDLAITDMGIISYPVRRDLYTGKVRRAIDFFLSGIYDESVDNSECALRRSAFATIYKKVTGKDILFKEEM